MFSVWHRGFILYKEVSYPMSYFSVVLFLAEFYLLLFLVIYRLGWQRKPDNSNCQYVCTGLPATCFHTKLYILLEWFKFLILIWQDYFYLNATLKYSHYLENTSEDLLKTKSEKRSFPAWHHSPLIPTKVLYSSLVFIS